MFPPATIGRGVHSMVIACVPRSKLEGLDISCIFLCIVHSSPFPCVCGDDRITRYPGADDLTNGRGDA